MEIKNYHLILLLKKVKTDFYLLGDRNYSTLMVRHSQHPVVPFRTLRISGVEGDYHSELCIDLVIV